MKLSMSSKNYLSTRMDACSPKIQTDKIVTKLKANLQLHLVIKSFLFKLIMVHVTSQLIHQEKYKKKVQCFVYQLQFETVQH